VREAIEREGCGEQETCGAGTEDHHVALLHEILSTLHVRRGSDSRNGKKNVAKADNGAAAPAAASVAS
jgi:hypothetical protein